MQQTLLHISFAAVFGTILSFHMDKNADKLKNNFMSEIMSET